MNRFLRFFPTPSRSLDLDYRSQGLGCVAEGVEVACEGKAEAHLWDPDAEHSEHNEHSESEAVSVQFFACRSVFFVAPTWEALNGTCTQGLLQELQKRFWFFWSRAGVSVLKMWKDAAIRIPNHNGGYNLTLFLSRAEICPGVHRYKELRVGCQRRAGDRSKVWGATGLWPKRLSGQLGVCEKMIKAWIHFLWKHLVSSTDRECLEGF